MGSSGCLFYYFLCFGCFGCYCCYRCFRCCAFGQSFFKLASLPHTFNNEVFSHQLLYRESNHAEEQLNCEYYQSIARLITQPNFAALMQQSPELSCFSNRSIWQTPTTRPLFQKRHFLLRSWPPVHKDRREQYYVFYAKCLRQIPLRKLLIKELLSVR